MEAEEIAQPVGFDAPPRPARTPTDYCTTSHVYAAWLTDAHKQAIHQMWIEHRIEYKPRCIADPNLMINAEQFARHDPWNPDRGGICYYALARVAIKVRKFYRPFFHAFAARFVGGTQDLWRWSRGDLILLLFCFKQSRNWFLRRNYRHTDKAYAHPTPFQCPIGCPSYLRRGLPYHPIWQEPFPEPAFVTTALDDPTCGTHYNYNMPEGDMPLYQINSAWPSESELRGGPVKRWNAGVPDIPFHDPEAKYYVLPEATGFTDWDANMSAE